MRAWFAIMLVGFLQGSQGRPPERWEYARLYTIRDVPTMLNLADSSVSMDSAAERQAQALGLEPLPKNQRRRVALLAILNDLGAQGWELVAVLDYPPVDRGYLFKRRRS